MNLSRTVKFGRWIVVLSAAAWCRPALASNREEGDSAPTPGARPMVGQETGEVRDDNGLKMKLVWCPPGRFVMGSPKAEVPRSSDEDQVELTLTKGNWLGKYEVTQSEWKQVMPTEPWKRGGSTKEGVAFPATNISWGAAMEFCRRLTEQERAADRLPADWEYTLPTEAQWERACRAGTETRYSFSNDGRQLGEFAWFVDNTRLRREIFAHPVGEKKPNPWGLHDMHGNVWEWCRDWYRVRLVGGSDPEVTKGSLLRVLRGGSWDSEASECRSAYRGRQSPASQFDIYGFRVACSPVR